MDPITTLAGAFISQILRAILKKLGLFEYAQAIFYQVSFFIAAALAGCILYWGWLVAKDWGAIQAGLKHY